MTHDSSAASEEALILTEDGFPLIHNARELKSFICQPGRQEYKPIGRLLIEESLITPEQLRAAHQRARNGRSGADLINALKALGHVSDADIRQVMIRHLQLPWVKLRDFDVQPTIVNLLPVDVARQRHVMPLMECGQRLVVAMEDPFDNEALDVLHFVTGHPIEVAVASRGDIEYAIGKHYGSHDVADVMEEMASSGSATEPDVSAEDILRMGQERPIVRFVQNLIMDAIHARASDIHIRPREKTVDLYYRIDGSLVKIRSFDRALLPAVVSRIKIIGGMDIAEHRVPQDGRSKIRHDANTIDLRLSILPSIHGESVVIRILDTQAGLRTLDEIGFTGPDRDRFTDLLMHNNGMILVTGPTGSGKSTTLYAALQKLRASNVNIITVEDPVEYHVDGVVQIQVRNITGYTFARALRHILRHDPDVIMVGEIRDLETARMAVESSLTGHIVLSTLHTNSAAATITRLLEIGIEPYLVNTSLLGVLAQRLVRLNCAHCKEQEAVDPLVRKMMKVSEDEVFWKGKGCGLCHDTGYHGRRAVYELLSVTPVLRRSIVEGANVETIEQQAIADGMTPLTQCALDLARAGETSLEEVYRIRLQ
ncbi:MAG TPA: GspE/PulE family protein [Pseudomonadales bacterium]